MTIQLPARAGSLKKHRRLDAIVGLDVLARTGFSIDYPDGYSPSIDGVLGVLPLDCERVQFDFERKEFAWR